MQSTTPLETATIQTPLHSGNDWEWLPHFWYFQQHDLQHNTENMKRDYMFTYANET